MASDRIKELEDDIANRDQVLKTTYEILDQIKADRVFDNSKSEETIRNLQEVVNNKEQEILCLEEKYSTNSQQVEELRATLDAETSLRKRLESELKASIDAGVILEEKLQEADRKVAKLEQTIEQEDIVHWRLIEKLQVKHENELKEAKKCQQDAISYVESELKIASEYFGESKKFEEERQRAIVDELTYDLGRLRTAVISNANETATQGGNEGSYAIALVEISKLKNELRSCRSVVDNFKVAAEDWERKHAMVQEDLVKVKETSAREISELSREVVVLRATSRDKDLNMSQETLKIDLMSAQFLLSECRRQLEHAESLVLSHQRDKEEAEKEKDAVVEEMNKAMIMLSEAGEEALEAQKSADNWKRECEEARRLCVTSMTDIDEGETGELALASHELESCKSDLRNAELEVKKLKAANEMLMGKMAEGDGGAALNNALGIKSRVAGHRMSLALGDGEGLVENNLDKLEVEELKQELKRVHRCLDGAAFESKQVEQRHAQEVDKLLKQIAEMEKDFGDRRRALQEELSVLQEEERKRSALSPELSSQGKTFQEMTVEHLNTLLEEERKMSAVLEFRVQDAERKMKLYQDETNKVKHDMELSATAKNNLEFKLHSLYSEIALHRSLRGLRLPGMADQLIVLSKTAQEYVSESVKETAYLCWALVRVFDGDGKDLSEFQTVDTETGVSKPYRLPQSSWPINRAIFSDPQDLLSSLDRISPQMITPFKTHPAFTQLKSLAKKRAANDVSSVSMSCGYLWGWIANTLVCADVSVNIDVVDG